MLSKKMAFSLTSLITIFALAFVASTAMAADGGPTVTISTADHHFDDGKQVVLAAITPPGDSEVADAVKVTIEFSDVVNFNATVADATPNTGANFSPTADVMWVFTNGDGVEQTAPTTITWDQINGKKYEAVFAPGTAITKVIVYVPADVATAVTGSTQGKGNQASGAYEFSIVAADAGDPYPVRMVRLIPESDFTSAKVTGPFDVKIVLSEKPKAFTKANVKAKNGSVTAVIDGGAVSRADYLNGDIDGTAALYNTADNAIDTDGAATDTDPLMPMATGNVREFYQYKATITPNFKGEDVIVWVTDFEDRALAAKKYEVARTSAGATRTVPDDLAENKEKTAVIKADLTGVDKPTAAAGTSVGIANDTIIPMGGYLVVASDDGDGANDAEKSSETGIMHPGDAKDANLAGSGRSARAQLYNVVIGGLRDLETFLINDGTIDLITTDGTGAVISEVMWGTDASLANPEHNQWIEIRNTSGAQIKTKDYKLMFYEANEALPDMTAADSKIADRLSTRNWNIAGTGQSGRSMAATGGDQVQFAGTTDIVSMQRSIDAAGMAKDGTMASSWASSERPSVNFKADALGRVGSPGAMPINYPAPPPPEDPPVTVDAAMASDIMITEIMVDTGSGRLPQWIELTNVAGKEVSLAGWSLEIENSAADADVIGTSISIDLSGTLGIGGGEGAGGTKGKSLLLVAGMARSSSNLAGSDRVVDISAEVEQKGRYTLLSPMGFMITLLPRQTTGIVEYGDMAGNLDAAEAWDIPMSDSGRSSLIRREMDAGMMTKGTDANGWILASATPLVSGPTTWYGSDEDAGTPGYDAGGPLPVELSHFRPARDKATGAVVITWATQSELNNAGFFIKRSNQRNGEFQVINATMVPGAGTTSEKQFYTYTDTTAQPNIVYYYQIEDVSLDGQRQTLTRGIRLKGHIGAAGKLTSTWGELKSSNE